MNRRDFFGTVFGASVSAAVPQTWWTRLYKWLRPVTSSQVIALQYERVRSKLPLLFEGQDRTFAMIESRKLENVSSRTARIPLQLIS